MRPFKMTMLAAAAAAALAAIAVVALPAIGDSGTAGTDQSPDVSGYAACLSAHGLPGAPSTAAELKPWLAGKASQDPGAVQAATDACQSKAPDAGASGPDPATMIACVRSHGIDAPADPADFKRWLGEQQPGGRSKALDDALVACKIEQGPQDKGDARSKPDCGAPADKPRAAKPAPQGDTNPK
jgi:hypothetical protein